MLVDPEVNKMHTHSNFAVLVCRSNPYNNYGTKQRFAHLELFSVAGYPSF